MIRYVLQKKILMIGIVFSLLIPSGLVYSFEITRIPRTPIKGDFLVGPAKREVSAFPGDRTQTEFTVTNRMGEDRQFVLNFEDFKGTREVSNPIEFIGTNNEKTSLAEHIFVEQRSFALKHGERAKIPVSVFIPSITEPGGLAFAINVSSEPVESISSLGSKTLITPEISVLVFVNVLGDAISSGSLKSFGLKNNDVKWDGQLPVFRILYENDGTKHLNPYGVIEIKNKQETILQTIVIDPWFVLPDSLRTRDLEASEPLDSGEYSARLLLNRGYEDIVDESVFDFEIESKNLNLITTLFVLFLFFCFVAIYLFVRKKRQIV